MRRKAHGIERRPVSRRGLSRREPVRKPNKRVLIVCEGSKTEPTYFRDAIDSMRLSTADVVVSQSKGSSPFSVVNTAKEIFKAEKHKGDPYDRVFCVFDRDEHASFAAALDAVKGALPAKTFESIVSVPCFEYWILLHFEYTTQPFPRTGSKSSCDCVMSRVKNHVHNYRKSQTGLFADLKDKLPIARTRSQRVCAFCTSSGATGPKTDVHRVFDFLETLVDENSTN